MAQKTNPTILRINKTNSWASRYIEKKSNEFHLNTSKDLEIKNYVYIYLKKKGLLTQSVKTYYYNTHLVLVLYYQQSNTSFFILKSKEKYNFEQQDMFFTHPSDKASLTTEQILSPKDLCQKIQTRESVLEPLAQLSVDKNLLAKLQKTLFKGLKKSKCEKTKDVIQKRFNFLKAKKKLKSKKRSLKLKKIFKRIKKHQQLLKNVRNVNYFLNNTFFKKKKRIYSYINKIFYKKSVNIKKNSAYYNLKQITLNKITRLKSIKRFKVISNLEQHKTFKNMIYNSFLNPLFEGLKQFFPKMLTFKLLLKPLNNNNLKKLTLKQKKYLAKKLGSYRRYEKNKFFFEGLNILFSVISTKNSSRLLSNYIALELKNLKKKHSFFIRFIKLALNLFLKNLFTPIVKSIKIEIKGRINGSGRARKRKILIGNLPVLTLDSNINYFKSTSFTRNGTLSVKVWILYN